MVRRLWMVVATSLSTAVAPAGALRAASAPSSPPVSSSVESRAVLDQYCVTCHNERLKTAGLTLDKIALDRVAENAAVWEKVVRKLRTGAMPPSGARRPDKARTDAIATWLETTLDRAASLHPNPGRQTVHRLNRTEYANAVRDLLALEIDVSGLLPPDDSSYGFDNIADVLKVAPSLLEAYLSAAWTISRVAVGAPSMTPTSVTYSVPPDLTQDNHIDGLPLGTRGGTLIRHTFPVSGEYGIKVRLGRTTWGTIKGIEFPHTLDIRVDGQLVKRFEVGGIGRYSGQDIKGHDRDLHLNVRVPVTAGPHDVAVTFPKDTYAQAEGGNGRYSDVGPLELRKPFIKSYVDYGDVNGLPFVHRVFVDGPFPGSQTGDTPSRRRVFVCHPSAGSGSVEPVDGRPTLAAGEASCARRIISTLARRAYRRPVTAAEVQGLVRFYETKRRSGGFDAGIQMAIRAMLVQPEFLFRIEQNRAAGKAGDAYPVTDLDLASRLSFFLWSSIPDDKLLRVAESGRLRVPAVLTRQVRRLLRDPRSQSLVGNFAAQWLYTRNMQAAFPNGALFPDFDDNLRQAMRRETELLFDSILREDRSVRDLLTADYTFVNERLARHYGIPNVYGSNFRRVANSDQQRLGLLAHGSILTVTSYATRTSPVQRGKWILENILGTPPPEPPPNVPPLPDSAASTAALTMRQRMEQHRANPVCSSCHSQMDPLGLALESYDAIGHGRTPRGESAEAIDVSGVMPDGKTFEGVAGLRDILMGRSDQFVQTLTERLLTYALGRGVEPYDMPAIRAILRDAAPSGDTLSSIVLGIVKSTPFQMRKTADGPSVAVPAH